MAELKTRKTRASVKAFLDALPDAERRADCRKVVRLMREVTGAKAAMWGPSIVGFGQQMLRYASGRELEWPIAAFSPRKQDLVLYCLGGYPGQQALLKRLGRHKAGKSCLYIRRLADVDQAVLKQLIEKASKPSR
jgi:hypothetical protein